MNDTGGRMYTCLNTQLKLRDYNKINTNGDGDDRDVVVGDGDDAQSSLDPDGGEYRCPSASSLSRSPLEINI
jgi:hypothetical protein